MIGFTEKTTAQDIMNPNVVTIGASKTVREAVESMVANNTRKIVVSEGGEWKGILDNLKISKKDLDKKVSEMKLKGIQIIHPETDVEQIRKIMHTSSTLLVLDAAKKSQGIITYTDWMRSRGLI